MRSFYVVMVIFVALLIGGEKKPTGAVLSDKNIEVVKPAEPPKLDLSTPEKAIYSYQAAQNWMNHERVLAQKKLFEEYQEKFENIEKRWRPVTDQRFSNRVLQIIKQNEEYEKNKIKEDIARQYEFSIVEMKKETDTRVIALVKVANVTPVSGVIMSEDNKKKREEGEKFKFELELDNNKWLITQISDLSFDNVTPMYKISSSADNSYNYTFVSLY